MAFHRAYRSDRSFLLGYPHGERSLADRGSCRATLSMGGPFSKVPQAGEIAVLDGLDSLWISHYGGRPDWHLLSPEYYSLLAVAGSDRLCLEYHSTSHLVGLFYVCSDANNES